jgi:hypothetical protein
MKTTAHAARLLCSGAMTLAISLSASVTSGATGAERPHPDYKGFRQAAHLRFLNAGDDREMRHLPVLGISFGERYHRAVLDTGSTGVVVGATQIPNLPDLPVIADGELTYTSSGRIMRGHWVTTSFTIIGAGDNSVQTEPMPVLAVDRVDCLPHARDCDPNQSVDRIAMIGVGFAREGDRQSQSTPDKNPFLHILPNEGGAQRHGYVLTSTGVSIGLSNENTRGPFEYVKLRRNERDTDWAPLPACLSINAVMPPACGSLLVDTGVASAFMTVPEQQAPGNQLQPGDTVAVSLPHEDGFSPLYTFSVDDGSPLTPDRIHLRVARERVFLNTSFHFLNGFDVLFDADEGYVGFRSRSRHDEASQ